MKLKCDFIDVVFWIMYWISSGMVSIRLVMKLFFGVLWLCRNRKIEMVMVSGNMIWVRLVGIGSFIGGLGMICFGVICECCSIVCIISVVMLNMVILLKVLKLWKFIRIMLIIFWLYVFGRVWVSSLLVIVLGGRVIVV